MGEPYDPEKQKALNQAHLSRPKIGDYWHEMFMPVLTVLDVTPRHVVVRRPSGTHVLSRRAFKKLLRYDTNDRTWADVSPASPPTQSSSRDSG